MLIYLINAPSHRTVAVATTWDKAIAWLASDEGKASQATLGRGCYVICATSTDHEGPESWAQVFGRE